ncbi:MAG: radical SAM protein [Deltaproteobacteria bacterium]
MDFDLMRGLAALRDAERGLATKRAEAPLSVVLAYPSPYHVGMSSLGFLQVHRLANARPLTRCDRAFLPTPDELEVYAHTHTPLLTVERQQPAGEAHVIAISQAYELELAGVVRVLRLAGYAPLAADRDPADPLVVLGGPITFSNPLPSAPFADVLILGEAEAAWPLLLSRLEERPEAARGDAAARRAMLEQLADEPGFFVPSVHGETLPPIAQAPDDLLPAVSTLRTANTELSNMVLIEPERGCHRGCTFCVMRRSTNGGMRLVPPDVVDRLVPEDAERVGLVGAAVTDHPGIKEILGRLVDERGLRIGISSLRADRLDDTFVGLLHRGGYRSMTVALDAASTRLRDSIEKNLKDRHVENAAALAKQHGMRHLKLYVIVGLPGETDEDRQELVRFAKSLAKTLPVVLGVSPFVPKFHTPLADAPFAGEAQIRRILSKLERAFVGTRVTLRGPGAREAYVEYRLAQGGFQHAAAAVAATDAGATLAAWKKALKPTSERVRFSGFERLVPAPTLRRRWRPQVIGA